jgi:uncharacterized protein (TIGR03118 family)
MISSSHRRACALTAALALGLTSCSPASGDGAPAGDGSAGFTQTNLVANWKAYRPLIVEPDLQNAWGISLRPAGEGGHFWVTANATGKSFEYVGDVGTEKLHTDELKVVDVPTVGGDAGTPTGTVFNEKGTGFVITQRIRGHGRVKQSAKFLFATDDGLVTAWTEVKHGDGTFARPTDSTIVFDRSQRDSSFLGMAISPADDRLLLADFGAEPGLVVLDDTFRVVKRAGFASPFAQKYQPFNVQTIGGSIFVTYAAWGSAGEEEPAPGAGRVAEFSPDGGMLQVWSGGRFLDAPWGIAKAPDSGFGTSSGDLLVGNFGDGTIAVLDAETHKAVDFLRRPDGHRVEIDGLWGLTFGNGESLGEQDSLYFAAGPGPEADGVFGRLTWTD